jgi:biotin transport system substrate-specific component
MRARESIPQAPALRSVLSVRTGWKVAGLALAVVATAIGAQVRVPLPWTTVPMTLQPLFVILAGALLGTRLGAASMAVYLAVGVLGAPVFSGGGAGVGWLMGPTGGYLVAFPAAAGAVGWLAGDRAGGSVRLFVALVAGLALIYLGGVTHLAILTGRDWSSLLALGVLPFLGGDLVKVLIALIVARPLRPISLGRF